MHRSPAMLRICQAATHHFAQNGYYGASLNDIAQAVGIRKASLYAHFKSKDELFMMVFADALLAEKEFVTECFANHNTTAGHCYFWQMKQRHKEAISLHLMLQTVYFPPKHLRYTIDVSYREYFGQLQGLFTQQLCQQPDLSHLNAEDIEHFSQAYVGIIDSLHVELVYTNGLDTTGQFVQNRQNSLWRLFQQALKQSSHESSPLPVSV